MRLKGAERMENEWQNPLPKAQPGSSTAWIWWMVGDGCWSHYYTLAESPTLTSMHKHPLKASSYLTNSTLNLRLTSIWPSTGIVPPHFSLESAASSQWTATEAAFQPSFWLRFRSSMGSMTFTAYFCLVLILYFQQLVVDVVWPRTLERCIFGHSWTRVWACHCLHWWQLSLSWYLGFCFYSIITHLVVMQCINVTYQYIYCPRILQ